MEVERESYLADEGETNFLFEMSKLFDQVILLLRQTMNSFSYIRRFNILMSYVGDNKIVEYMLKDNSTAFSVTGNMLLESKYEKLVAKSLGKTQKIDQKSSLVLQKLMNLPRRKLEVSPFEKAHYLEHRK